MKHEQTLEMVLDSLSLADVNKIEPIYYGSVRFFCAIELCAKYLSDSGLNISSYATRYLEILNDRKEEFSSLEGYHEMIGLAEDLIINY